jgi:hypothetical protein
VKRLNLAGVLTFGLSLLASSGFAQSVTIGNPPDSGNGNSFPFGFSIAAYQQVYAAGDFSGPITINGLSFFNTAFTAGSIQTATYNIQLSTTSAPVNGLSNTFAANLGADNTMVFLGTLSGAAAPNFTISTTPFNYQPANGNLLLTIFKTNITGPNSSVFLDARNGTAAGLFSRKYAFSSTTTAENAGFDSNWGIVTRFNASAVPEPGTLALLFGSGMTVTLFAARRLRRRRK